ncbi:hypothetical protein HanRHA438_Chr08g0372771 [Helianthus annuus]|nr:hypothetical protein HanRHA438_Chr08g0372771 [Helianthus annuus]
MILDSNLTMSLGQVSRLRLRKSSRLVNNDIAIMDQTGEINNIPRWLFDPFIFMIFLTLFMCLGQVSRLVWMFIFMILVSNLTMSVCEAVTGPQLFHRGVIIEFFKFATTTLPVTF